MAKGRIAPTRQLSISRLESCEAVISCRIHKLIEDELSYKFSSVMHIIDSPIVRVQTEKESYVFSDDLKEKYQRLGPYKTEDGAIIVGQRLAHWLEQNWNQDNFILLPKKHLFTLLFISHLHNTDHARVDGTLCKLQTNFGVSSARKIIRSVKRNCVTCRRLDSKVEGQSMGQVAAERISPCPAFSHTATDIFGSFQIRDSMKKRITGRAYGIIFNCMVLLCCIYIDVDGYDIVS